MHGYSLDRPGAMSGSVVITLRRPGTMSGSMAASCGAGTSSTTRLIILMPAMLTGYSAVWMIGFWENKNPCDFFWNLGQKCCSGLQRMIHKAYIMWRRMVFLSTHWKLYAALLENRIWHKHMTCGYEKTSSAFNIL